VLSRDRSYICSASISHMIGQEDRFFAPVM